MLRWVCVCLLCLCGCGPFALGSGAASILAPKGGSGDLSDPTVSIRRDPLDLRDPQPQDDEAPPVFIGRPVPEDATMRPELRLLLDVNKPTVIELQLLVVHRPEGAPAELLFGSAAAAAAPDLEALVANCRNAAPNPLTGEDPCAEFFAAPPTPVAQTGGFSLTLIQEFVTLSELEDGSYTILVRAFDSSQETSDYDDHDFVVDTQLPSAPTITQIGVPGPRQLRLEWQQASDVGSGVESYAIHFHVGGDIVPDQRLGVGTLYEGTAEDPFDGLILVPAADLAFTLQGLRAGRVHYLQVAAIDFAGNQSRLSAFGERAASTRIGADGLFDAAKRYEAGSSPDRVRTGDFNGDTILDLAVMHAGTSDVSVLLGNGRATAPRLGDGTFGAPLTISALDGLAVIDIEVADVTEDGLSDIVAMGSLGRAAHLAVVRLVVDAAGAASLERVQDFEVHALLEPRDLIVAEMSGDGRPDALVAGLIDSTADFENSARLHLAGPASVPFQPAGRRITFFDGAFTGVTRAATGSFDAGDSLPDLIFGVANTLHSDHGTGAGSFSGTTTTASTGAIRDMLSAELNSDSLRDVIVTHPGGTFDVFTGAGRDQFGIRFFPPLTPIRIADTGESVVTLGEFNTDGIADLAFAVRVDHATDEEPVKVRYGGGSNGRGDGTFPLGRSFAVRVAADAVADDTTPTSLATGDFNGDRIQDLAVTTPATGHVRVLLGRGALGRGDGSFAPGASLQRDSELLLEAAADFDGDGILDLAGIQDLDAPFYLLVEKTRGTGTDGVGDGGFFFTGLSGIAFALPGRKRMVAAEVTGNSPTDFLTVNGSRLAVHHTLSNGTFTGAFNYATGSFGIYSPRQQQPPVLADFDRDGNADVAIATSDGLSIFPGTPGQTIASLPILTLTATTPTNAFCLGDFDGNGNPDLCFLDLARGKILFAAGRGSGPDPFAGLRMEDLPVSAANLIQDLPPALFHTLAAADFDLDGHDDLCLVTAEGDVRVLLWRPGERLTEVAGVAAVADGSLVTDAGRLALFRVALDGTITLVKGGLVAPGAVVANADFAYLLDGDRIVQIDLSTSDLTVVATGFDAPTGLALDGDRLLVSGAFLDADDMDFVGLLGVEIATGDVTFLSASGAQEVGDGDPFVDPAGVALATGTAILSDRGTGVLVIVDLATGDRTPLGSALSAPTSLVVDDDRLLVLDGETLYEVDLASGDQTSLFDDSLLSRSRALAHDGAGDRALLAIASEMGDPSSLRSIHLAQKKLRHAAADGPFALPMELEGDLEGATDNAFEGPGVEPAVPGEPSFAAAQVRIADVNSDGVPDLVLLSRSRPALAVLLSETDDAGHATGTFAAPVVTLLPVATAARSMVVGDFNSDGIPDAAVATRFAATHRIQIFLGGGTLEGR